MGPSFLRPALGGALVFAASESFACEGQPEHAARCPTTYGSIGPLVSFGFGERGSFGIGGEVSASHLPNNMNLQSYGAFVNEVHYFTRSTYDRLTAGGQLSMTALGSEAGLSFLSGSSGAYDAPPTFGGTLGGFGEVPTPIPAGTKSYGLRYMPFMLFVAFRMTLPGAGAPQGSVDIGLKLPVLLSGPGYYIHSGRPFRVDGMAVAARPWLEREIEPDDSCTRGLAREECLHMAARWLDAATNEHAAISSFCRLARQLVALGAPGELVLAALQAAEDEWRHTVACLTMAARYDGRVYTLPAPILDTSIRVDVRELVQESFLDGCLGEGVAAEVLRARAAVAMPARGRSLLRAISCDELLHAELGLEVLRFATMLDGGRGDAARRELRRLVRETHASSCFYQPDAVLSTVEGFPDPAVARTLDAGVSRCIEMLAA